MPESKEQLSGFSLFHSYARPFTKSGCIPFILSFALALIPFIQIMAFPLGGMGISKLKAAGFKRYIITALKTLWIALILFAPALAAYFAVYLLVYTIAIGPIWLLYILSGLMLLLAVSAMIRLPMALFALVRGHSLKEAASARFVKQLISACFGRYIASLLGLIPFVALTVFMDFMPFWISYVYAALLTAWLLNYLSYAMARCYDKAAYILASPPPESNNRQGFQRSVATLLALAMLMQPSKAASAFNEDEALAQGNYPQHRYTADEYNAAYERFIKNGQLHPGTHMRYNTDTGNFYCVAKPAVEDRTLVWVALSFTADCLPVIGTVKNSYEAYQYKKIADDPKRSAEERAAARAMQYYKLFAAGLSVAGPLGKAASTVTGKGVVPFLITKAGHAVTDPSMIALINAFDEAVWVWDRVGDTGKLAGIVDKDVGDLFEGFSPEGVLGASKPTPAPFMPGAQTAPPDFSEPKAVSPGDDFAPFWGTYKGTLTYTRPDLEMTGAKASFTDSVINITLTEKGAMSLSYTYTVRFTYDYGDAAHMDTVITLPVNISSVYTTKTLAGYMGDYSTRDAVATVETVYGGKAYQDKGGSYSATTPFSIKGSLVFRMERVGDDVYVVADGAHEQRAIGMGAEQIDSLIMSFVAKKVS